MSGSHFIMEKSQYLLISATAVTLDQGTEMSFSTFCRPLLYFSQISTETKSSQIGMT